MIPWSLIWGAVKPFVGPAIKYLFIAGVLAFAWWQLTEGAYKRGFAARDAEAREQIQRMEERLAKRMRENEGLDDAAIDCALRRLRNPKAECGK